MLRYFSPPLSEKMISDPRFHSGSCLKKLNSSLQFPDFVENQKKSVNTFWTQSLLEEFELFCSVTGKKKKLHIIFSGAKCILQKPQFSFEFLLKNQKTYSVSLFVPTKFAWLEDKNTIFSHEFPVYFGEIPVMTERGSFLINGASRVLVNQILRCPSVYFKVKIDPKNRRTYTASFLSEYGSWLRFETDTKNRVWFRIDKSQRFPIYTLLRSLGFPENFLKFQLKNYSFLEPSRQEYLALMKKERVSHVRLAELAPSLADLNRFSSSENSLVTRGMVSKRNEGTVGAHEPSRPIMVNKVDNSPAEVKEQIYDSGNFNVSLGSLGSLPLDRAQELSLENPHEAIQSLWQKINPGRWNSPQGCYTYLYNKFFNPKRYSIGLPGRARLNRRLGRRRSVSLTQVDSITTLTPEDILLGLDLFLGCNYSEEGLDDIDHLKNRRVRLPGELMQNQFRVALSRILQTANEKLSKLELDFETRGAAVLTTENFPVRDILQTQFFGAAFRELFHTSQLSQYMDETNPLAEITHKRRLSSLGPGGIGRDQAGFAIREIHPSHFGRICPIETPEGQNAGLVGSLASFASLTPEGFLQSPYRAFETRAMKNWDWFLFPADVEDEFAICSDVLVDDFVSRSSDESSSINALEKSYPGSLPGSPADAGAGQSGLTLPNVNEFSSVKFISISAKLTAPEDDSEVRTRPVRYKQEFLTIPETQIQFFGISPIQMISCATSLIPFLEHDDANRALMGSNMQRQAVPCLYPEQALVGTGLEKQIARDSSGLLIAEKCGQIRRVTGVSVEIKHEENFVSSISKEHLKVDISSNLSKPDPGALPVSHMSMTRIQFREFSRSNQNTSLVQKPCCSAFEWIQAGDLLADGGASFHGEIALGKNLCVAYMPWEGYNFEDAIVINERLVHEDIYTSIHIDRYEIETHDTDYGPELITKTLDFQNDLNFLSSNPKIDHLDDDGVVQVGSWVQEGDILVGRMTPIAPPKPTPEYRLLCAIFETKPRPARETSLRLPHGVQGRVLEILQSQTETGKKIQVFIAHTRRIQIGDKMSGRHGNKGIVSLILPAQDMPFLQDGTIVDIILNPLGVPSRMNVGQVLESLFGLAAKYMRQHYRLMAFDEMYGSEASRGLVYGKLYEASLLTHAPWLFDPNHPGKMIVFDGQTGEAFAQPILIGYSYMFKLIHLVDEKIHARSTGPYSLVTQQPLGGRSKHGGQRLGEMEVWALEGFGAAAILHEFLTIKSDDIDSRNTFLFHVMKRKYFPQERLRACLPESFRVLVHELQALCLSVYYNPDFLLSYPGMV